MVKEHSLKKLLFEVDQGCGPSAEVDRWDPIDKTQFFLDMFAMEALAFGNEAEKLATRVLDGKYDDLNPTASAQHEFADLKVTGEEIYYSVKSTHNKIEKAMGSRGGNFGPKSFGKFLATHRPSPDSPPVEVGLIDCGLGKDGGEWLIKRRGTVSVISHQEYKELLATGTKPNPRVTSVGSFYDELAKFTDGDVPQGASSVVECITIPLGEFASAKELLRRVQERLRKMAAQDFVKFQDFANTHVLKSLEENLLREVVRNILRVKQV